jgi:omega-hydroxy-beta-dihydromenaquinone-9 sulfotransferase
MATPSDKPRRPLLAFPYPHFMAFAPLDVWVRILLFPVVWVSPRYWVRLAAVLFTSAIGTVLTLPERLVFSPLLHVLGRRRGMRLEHKPGVVVILGYFRSGTTHLHYLLSGDPNFRTPAWCETLVPHGFVASWAFLRVFLIPWIGSKRPQDDMDLGPSWPAEDDFAQNNGAAASSLPWRFVVPRAHAHYSRFHFLEGLTAREMSRWRGMQYAFCWKISRLAGERAILLKSPSHLARVRALLETFGPENVKFIHISRDSRAVIESNVAMFRRMAIFGLQDRKPDDEVRALITDEYIRSEENYLRDLALIPPGRVAEIRYEDLVADPMGQIKRAYQELSLEFTPEFERHAVSYLHAVSDYRAAQPARAVGAAKPGTEPDAGLAQIERRFRHDAPPVPAASLPPDTSDRTTRQKRAMLATILTALFTIVAWCTISYLTRERINAMIWPSGAAIGLAAIWVAGVGNRKLAFVAAACTVMVQLSVAVPVAFLSEYAHRPYYYRAGALIPMPEWEWRHILGHAREGLVVGHNLFWGFMGAVTAFRFASRRYVQPPGTW